MLGKISKKKQVLLGVLVTAALVFVVDDLSSRLNVPSRDQFSTYMIRRYYYINENFGKYSVESAGQVPEKCVNSMFPHFGSRPCWYVRTHLRQVIHVN